ncbi:hypothetical protein LPJ73_006076 [Coemansia sp. RSA 2703]|nr:hypothetical protein LPJ73_006076 [Coemansia sp. RSA 2703]KAJ2375307.1 hypothetical protein IW150_002618 [Coemansia sp. RSA 2607]
MSSFVLHYFPINARAEPIKAILSYAGANWKLESPEWPQGKSSQPVGKLPVLVETAADGSQFTLSESLAIEEYLAKTFSLNVSDNLQNAARQTELRSQIKDVWDMCIQYKFGTEESRKGTMEKYAALSKAVVAYHEEQLKLNGANGHYFGSETKYLDLAVFATYLAIKDFIVPSFPQALDNFSKENAPLMNKVFETVSAEPRLASYLTTFN